MARVTIEDLSAKTDVRFDRVDARFDAVDSRFEQVDARLDQVDTRLGQVDTRLAQVDTRLQQVDARLDVLVASTDREFSAIQEHFVEMRDFIAEGIASVRRDMTAGFTNAHASLHESEARTAAKFAHLHQRFDRIEDKLDRALAPRPPRGPRRRG